MRVVDENAEPLEQRRRGRKNIYEWDKWLQHRKTTEIVQGEDFHVEPSTLVPQIYNAAKRRGGVVHVHHGDGVLRITFELTSTDWRAQPVTSKRQLEMWEASLGIELSDDAKSDLVVRGEEAFREMQEDIQLARAAAKHTDVVEDDDEDDLLTAHEPGTWGPAQDDDDEFPVVERSVRRKFPENGS